MHQADCRRLCGLNYASWMPGLARVAAPFAGPLGLFGRSDCWRQGRAAWWRRAEAALPFTHYQNDLSDTAGRADREVAPLSRGSLNPDELDK